VLSLGHPYFISRAGRPRLGVLLTGDTDWEGIRELVIESYRSSRPNSSPTCLTSAAAGLYVAAFCL